MTPSGMLNDPVVVLCDVALQGAPGRAPAAVAARAGDYGKAFFVGEASSPVAECLAVIAGLEVALDHLGGHYVVISSAGADLNRVNRGPREWGKGSLRPYLARAHELYELSRGYAR